MLFLKAFDFYLDRPYLEPSQSKLSESIFSLKVENSKFPFEEISKTRLLAQWAIFCLQNYWDLKTTDV